MSYHWRPLRFHNFIFWVWLCHHWDHINFWGKESPQFLYEVRYKKQLVAFCLVNTFSSVKCNITARWLHETVCVHKQLMVLSGELSYQVMWNFGVGQLAVSFLYISGVKWTSCIACCPNLTGGVSNFWLCVWSQKEFALNV